MKFVYAKGATPFNQDDFAQLIPKHITTQMQLNEWEQANIIHAEKWLFSRKRKDLLTIDFIKKLHLKMFDKTWLWAGKFRHHQTNIGLPSFQIQPHLKILCDDVQFWISNQIFPSDEVAIQFHHRLVHIHPFPNGNGRHSRLIADALLIQMGAARFSWGRKNLALSSDTRHQYISALKLADKGDYQHLLKFARS